MTLVENHDKTLGRFITGMLCSKSFIFNLEKHRGSIYLIQRTLMLLRSVVGKSPVQNLKELGSKNMKFES